MRDWNIEREGAGILGREREWNGCSKTGFWNAVKYGILLSGMWYGDAM